MEDKESIIKEEANPNKTTEVAKNEEDVEEKEPSAFEKILQLNKLGSLFLAGGSNAKAKTFLSKTITFYEEKIANKEIPNIFYGNLYCNYAKALSVDKEFDQAEILYRKVIDNHPFKRTLDKEKEYILNVFFIDVEDLYSIKEITSEEEIKKRFNKIVSLYLLDDNKITFELPKKFFKNTLNSISCLSDALLNLAVIFQIKHKETLTSFNMFCLALMLEPDNSVANIDFNGFLRENNFKELSDLFITARIKYDSQLNNEKKENSKKDNSMSLVINPIKANIWKDKSKYFYNITLLYTYIQTILVLFA